MKALVVGLGIGMQHVKAYKEEGLEVAAYDTDETKRGDLVFMDDLQSAMKWADIISICTPDEHHFHQVQRAIDLDKYVVVEKPPCLTRDEMAWLMKNDSKLYCNLPLPFHFKDLLAEFRSREPYLIELDYLWGRHHKLVDGWRANGGYSIVLGAGLHLFDLMLCFKEGVPCDGAALGANKSGVNAPFDCVQSVMRWEDGTLARVGINCAFEGDHAHRVAVYTRDYHRVVLNKTSVDKTAGIRDFLGRISRGDEISNDRLWRAMNLCFEMENAAGA